MTEVLEVFHKHEPYTDKWKHHQKNSSGGGFSRWTGQPFVFFINFRYMFSPQDVLHLLCTQIFHYFVIYLQHLVSWEQDPICRAPCDTDTHTKDWEYKPWPHMQKRAHEPHVTKWHTCSLNRADSSVLGWTLQDVRGYIYSGFLPVRPCSSYSGYLYSFVFRQERGAAVLSYSVANAQVTRMPEEHMQLSTHRRIVLHSSACHSFGFFYPLKECYKYSHTKKLKCSSTLLLSCFHDSSANILIFLFFRLYSSSSFTLTSTLFLTPPILKFDTHLCPLTSFTVLYIYSSLSLCLIRSLLTILPLSLC